MSDTTPGTAPLTVVLVHGAFADASSWNGVVERLQRAGLHVTAPANPLRSLSVDSAYLASFLHQIPGPVLLVGHSYGGAVMTNAATDVPNVVGLVYVAAFAPDEGERLGEVEAGSKDSVLNTALVPLQYPTGQVGRDGRGIRDRPRQVPRHVRRRPSPRAGRPDGFDATPGRGIRLLGGVGSARVESRTVLGCRGHRGQGGRQRRGPVHGPARGADITEAMGSHVIMISHPEIIVSVIMQAVAAVGQPAAAAR